MKPKGSAFRSAVFKGYASTYLVEFLVLVSSLLLYRVCSDFFGEIGLVELSVYRRIFSFLQPILLCGLLVGLTRYVAHESDRSIQFSYFISAFVFLFLVSLLCNVLFALFPLQLSLIFFDSAEFSIYILPLGISIAGALMHLMIYGYLRGKHEFVKANYLQAINMALVPLVVFFMADELSTILLLNGLLWISVSFFYFIFFLDRPGISMKPELNKIKILLKYGIPRIPGDIAFGALFALPVILISHFFGTEQAGRMAFSLTILNIVGAAFSPLSLMLLPTLSQKLKNKEFMKVKKEIKNAIAITFLLSFLGVLIFELFAEEILNIYIGDSISSWVNEIQVMMLGGVFFALFITLRSVIDAFYEKAINSINLIVSLCFYISIAAFVGFLDLPYIYFYWGFLLSLFVLAALTIYTIYGIQKQLNDNIEKNKEA